MDAKFILSEILVELYYNGYKIDETKTIWKNRVSGKSTVGFNEIFEAFIGVFKIYRKKISIKKKNKL